MNRMVFAVLALGAFMPVIALASQGSGVPAPTQALLDAYPGLQVTMDGSRVMAFHGKNMTSADTPQQAAEWWLADHASAFNVPGLDLRVERTNLVGQESARTVFVYKQYMDGVPVEFGMARLVVRNGSPNYVTLATGKLASPPTSGFAADTVTADEALLIAQSEYGRLTQWSSPTLVVYYGQDDAIGNIRPVRTWKIVASDWESLVPADDAESYSIFVNVADGAIVFARSEIYPTDITGTVHGMATPYLPKDATYPDDAQNPPSDQILEDVRVRIQGGSTTYSNADGTYLLPNAGDTNVLVQGDFIGPWVSVVNGAGAEIHLEYTVLPPGPQDFFFNAVPAEFTTGQVNGMIHATNEHDFFKERQPNFNGLDNVVTCEVNVNSSCNAYFIAPSTIQFFIKAGGCPNTAYSSVVTHEYGHYIVNQLGLGQGSFGEGTGDIVGDLMYNDPMTGRDFLGEGQILRDPIAANQQYPCGQEIHTCGMVVSGVFWDMHLNLWNGAIGDELASLAYVQQLWTDFMIITNGGLGNDGLYPTSAVEVLEAADDDNNPDTTGPYDSEICAAFAKHGIECPLTLLNFEFLNGDPTDLELNGTPCDVETPICFKVTAGDIGEPDPTSVRMGYRLGIDPVVIVPLTEIEPNTYQAILPAAAEGTQVTFRFSAKTLAGDKVTDPPDGGKYQADYVCGAPVFEPCFVPPSECEGDANGDGIVDPLDSGYSLSRFGCSVGTGDPECDAADQNQDGIVDPLDVGYILSRFGDCPA